MERLAQNRPEHRQGFEKGLTLNPKAPKCSEARKARVWTLRSNRQNHESEKNHKSSLSRDLVVSTHLKNISQNGKSSPTRGENKKYLKPPPSQPISVVHLVFCLVGNQGLPTIYHANSLWAPARLKGIEDKHLLAQRKIWAVLMTAI